MHTFVRTFLIGTGCFLLGGCQLFSTGPESIPTDQTPRQEMTQEMEEGAKTTQKFAALTDNFYEGGYINVRGYATEEEVDEVWCEENCKKYQYVAFHILPSEYESGALEQALQQNAGNAYVGDDAIGLGCDEDGVITYDNDSDEYGYETFTLSPELSTKILASTPEEPMDLQLVKYPLNGGREAFTCYAHFTRVETI